MLNGQLGNENVLLNDYQFICVGKEEDEEQKDRKRQNYWSILVRHMSEWLNKTFHDDNDDDDDDDDDVTR